MCSATGRARALFAAEPTPPIALAVIIIVAAVGFDYVASGGAGSFYNEYNVDHDEEDDKEKNGTDDRGDDTALLLFVPRLDQCDGGSSVDCSYAVCDRRRQFLLHTRKLSIAAWWLEAQQQLPDDAHGALFDSDLVAVCRIDNFGEASGVLHCELRFFCVVESHVVYHQVEVIVPRIASTADLSVDSDVLHPRRLLPARNHLSEVVHDCLLALDAHLFVSNSQREILSVGFDD